MKAVARCTCLNGVLQIVLPIVLLALGACTVSPPPAQEQPSDIALAYGRLASIQGGGITTRLELESLLTEFDRRDEVYGAWLTRFELCRYHMASSDKELAWNSCTDALARAQLSGNKGAIFTSAIQLYFYSGEERYLQLAQAHTARASDTEILAIAARDYAALSLPEREHASVAVRARQYYWYGKHHRDEAALAQAYGLFVDAGDSRGVADVLFLQAQMAARSSQLDKARELAGRARRVLVALGDQAKVAGVDNWVNRELDTH